MAKLSFDDSDGVWRTVGGRRIFIRTGESLSGAMKKSGKFKLSNKKKEEKNWRDKLKTPEERDEILNKELDESTREKAKDFWEKEDKSFNDLANEKKESEEQSPKKTGEVKDMIKVKDGTYLPIREGETEEDVIKAYNERQEKYRRNLEPEVSKNLRDPRRLWDQDLVDTYIEMNERGDFKDLPSEQRDKFTRNMKNMEGEPLYSPDRMKQSNGMKEINDKIANHETLTEEEFTKKIREIQARPSYKQKMDEAVSELNKKYGKNKETAPKNNEKYSVDYFKQRGVEIKDSVPEGYVKLEGATTAPNGYEWYSNGKSRFGGEYKNALVKTEENGNQITNTLRRKAYQKYLKEHPTSKITFEDFKDMRNYIK